MIEEMAQQKDLYGEDKLVYKTYRIEGDEKYLK